MKKKIFAASIITFIIIILSMSCGFKTHAMSKQTKEKCKQTEEVIYNRYGKGKVRFYKSKNLTRKILVRRKDKGLYIVEKLTGIVDEPKTGAGHAGKYYVSYKGVNGIRKGTKIRSYFVYNPKTSAVDDIIARYDVIIKK